MMRNDLKEAFADFINFSLDNNIVDIKYNFIGLTVAEMDKLYRASKQLSDLCWQEIKRRKATGTP